MEEKTLIYVAGNPDAYPLEYFDKDTQTYAGVIPELLAEFSDQSTYEIVYYEADGTDHREELAQQKQVDLFSGYEAEEEQLENTGVVTLFPGENAYALYFTEAAPDAFQSNLRAYLEQVSPAEVTGLLMASVETPPNTQGMYWTMGAMGAALLVMAAVLLLTVRRYRRRLKESQQNVETDETTGLGNMEYLERYYKQYINDKNRILYQAVYFYVDTDRLRRLSSGQETDEFLRYCAVVLGEYTQDSDILAKVSEHGFIMLKLTGGTDKTDAWLTAILDRIHDYAKLYGKPYETNIYAGIYALRAEDRDLNEIIFQASQGAYGAEKEDCRYLRCSKGMMDQFMQERHLQASIEQAFAPKEFQLYIQFYVNAANFAVVGGEALSRWKHPQKGVLLPSMFIPLMEREKMISRFDYYCLKEVCFFLKGLLKEGVDTFFVSCNFSRDTFAAADFVQKVQEIMNGFTFPRELLILEITESVSVRNAAQIRQNIIALKKYGVRVALDDFGEGFTSFYDLQKYPIDGIKLDKGLVDHVTTPIGTAILKAMIQVGHELNMTILAEGVETDEQVRAQQEIHCDVIQGFRFSHPMPQWEANAQIIQNRRT